MGETSEPVRLPPFLYGTYVRYLEDTRYIESCLLHSFQDGASQNDLHHPLPCSSRGGSEKLPVLGSHEITLSQFEPLAQALVAAYPPVNVPRRFVEATHRVLKARKKCAAWFQRNALSAVDQDRNSAHLHPVKVLERMLEVLEPRIVPLTVSNQDTKATDLDLGRLSGGNRFETLWCDNEADQIVQTDFEPPTPIASPVEASIYSNDTEQLFQCFCFLEDVAAIRAFIQQQWIEYSDGIQNVITASLLSNLGLNMIRDMEVKFVSEIEPGGSYRSIFIDFFFQKVCDGRGLPYRHCFGGEFDVFNENTADLVDLLMLKTWQIVESHKDVLSINRLYRNLAAHRNMAPSVKRDWTEREDQHHRYAQDRVIIMELFRDVPALFEANVHAEDFLVQCLYDHVTTPQQTSFSLVVAAQVFIDTQHTLRNHGLARAASEGIMTIHKSQAWLQSTLHWCQTAFVSHPRFTPEAPGIFKKVFSWWPPIISLLKNALQSAAYRRVLARCPMECGLQCFTLRMMASINGRTMSDLVGLDVSSAHIYNMIKQEIPTVSNWPDMDYVIHTLTPGFMFAGNLPRSMHDYGTRYRIVSGLSVLKLGCGRSGSAERPGVSAVRRNGLLVSECLFNMMYSKDHFHDYAETLEMLLILSRHPTKFSSLKRSGEASRNPAILQKACARMKRFSAVKTLESAKRILQEEVIELHFDHLEMCRACLVLEEQLRKEIPLFAPVDEDALGIVVGSSGFLGSTKDEPDGVLATLASILDRFLRSSKGSTSIRNIQVHVPGFEAPEINFHPHE